MVPEEVGYLLENVGLQGVFTTAKNLNHYYESIKVKNGSGFMPDPLFI